MDGAAPDAAQPVTGTEFLELVAAGADWLEANTAAVNALNVYPVPDGDTGTNMVLTLHTALRDARADQNDGRVESVAAVIARGALRGARGNSGVILSQYLQGLSRGLTGVDVLDAATLATALQSASDSAYQAMSNPVEGTMLTVARDAAEAAVAAAGQPDATTGATLAAATAGADESVVRTPDLLPVLKSAGVVDSGGTGIALILHGATARLTGTELGPPLEARSDVSIDASWLANQAEEEWGFCTEFVLMNPTQPLESIRATMALYGESESIVHGDGLVRVHLHTSTPENVLAEAESMGALEQVSIRDMDQQHQQFLAEHRDGQDGVVCGVVTVAAGPGFVRIMRGLGAGAIIWGGQTMNPSAEEIAEAVESIPTPEVIILPNNKNIASTAELASQLAGAKKVSVLPTASVIQGIAALLVYRNEDTAEVNLAGMNNAINGIHWAEVTRAVRAGVAGGLSYGENQPIGLLAGDLLTAGETPADVACDLVRHIAPHEAALVTIYYGAGVSEEEAEATASAVQAVCTEPDVEVEAVNGGQPLYPYLISVE